MYIERFFVAGLAHASYLVASEKEAIVIDPERMVNGYLDYLAEHQLTLKGIFLTHPHADFVAGHAELSSRSGAPILISTKAPATFAHRDLNEGDRIGVGALEVEVLAAPGHSPDSICLCLYQGGLPEALFSGDTLFAGDVGRPDLRDGEISPRELAAMLYDSLFKKLLKLPADIRVYPAHGAGSLCGRQISAAPFTTLGRELATNWALQLNERHQFIKSMAANLPDRPLYFDRSVTINLHGAPPFLELPAVDHLQLAKFNGLREEGATVYLDRK